jgi:hypothetical protein
MGAPDRLEAFAGLGHQVLYAKIRKELGSQTFGCRRVSCEKKPSYSSRMAGLISAGSHTRAARQGRCRK